MENLTIRFSHWYDKLRVVSKENPQARLLQVLVVNMSDLHPVFLDYDTQNHLFEFKSKGEHLLLIFEGATGLFTTIRPAWPMQKREYYMSNVGRLFNIVLAPPKSKGTPN